MELSETFISSGYMILQSGSISMFVKVSVLSLLPPPAPSFFYFQYSIFHFQDSIFDAAAAFKVFVVVVICVISLDYIEDLRCMLAR